MTTSPPDEPAGAETTSDEPATEAEPESTGSPTDEFTERIASLVAGTSWSADFGNAKVVVDRGEWVAAVTSARAAGLDFFSFLSAIDWSNAPAVGEALDEPVEERYEVIVRLSSSRSSDGVTLSTDVPKDDARLPTLTGVYGGANWHEREAAEMFGISFDGHPNLTKLYLPDAFEGFPLRKSYPLLSREVKPWPGMVDVEDEPSTSDDEAATATEAAPEDQSTSDGVENDGDGDG